MPLHPSAEMMIQLLTDSGRRRSPPTRRPRAGARDERGDGEPGVAEAPGARRSTTARSRARRATSRCACSGRARDAGAAGARVVPRRRLGHRQPRHPRPARAACSCDDSRARSWCRSTTGSRPRRSSPAAVDDCVAACEWVTRARGRARRRSGAGSRSAATARAATSPRSSRSIARERGSPQPKLQLLVYPVTDYEFDERVDDRQRQGLLPRGRGHALVLRSLRATRPPTSTTGACRRCARPTSPASRARS